jgi:tetratricopeptide (TPR) repeat protein
MGRKKGRRRNKREKKQGSAFEVKDTGGGIIPFPSSPPQFDPVSPKKTDKPASRLAMEQMIRELHEALDGQDFSSEEEIADFVRAFNQRGRQEASKSHGKRSGKHKAQDLVYQAMEAEDVETVAELTAQALDLDPDCVDALILLAQLTGGTREEMIEHARQAVGAGERSLGGKKFFKENEGYFWGLIETRPYMRARAYLAELLVEAGRNDEAVEHHEEMLRLNPNDNQGLRYSLLGLYFLADNLDGVRRLFHEYEDEGSAVFAWSRVLERHLSGDEKAATKALKDARKTNKHVMKYLTGEKRLPKNMPDYYGFGDENEAIICADAIGAAWKRSPKAVAWLKTSR